MEPYNATNSLVDVQCHDAEFLFVGRGSMVVDLCPNENHQSAGWMTLSFRARDTALGRFIQSFVDDHAEGDIDFSHEPGIRSPDGQFRIMKHGTVRCADCFLLLNLLTESEEFVVFVRNMGTIIAHHMTEQAMQCDCLWEYLREKHAIDQRWLDPWDAPYSPRRLPLDTNLPSFYS